MSEWQDNRKIKNIVKLLLVAKVTHFKMFSEVKKIICPLENEKKKE